MVDWLDKITNFNFEEFINILTDLKNDYIDDLFVFLENYNNFLNVKPWLNFWPRSVIISIFHSIQLKEISICEKRKKLYRLAKILNIANEKSYRKLNEKINIFSNKGNGFMDNLTVVATGQLRFNDWQDRLEMFKILNYTDKILCTWDYVTLYPSLKNRLLPPFPMTHNPFYRPFPKIKPPKSISTTELLKKELPKVYQSFLFSDVNINLDLEELQDWNLIIKNSLGKKWESKKYINSNNNNNMVKMHFLNYHGIKRAISKKSKIIAYIRPDFPPIKPIPSKVYEELYEENTIVARLFPNGIDDSHFIANKTVMKIISIDLFKHIKKNGFIFNIFDSEKTILYNHALFTYWFIRNGLIISGDLEIGDRSMIDHEYKIPNIDQELEDDLKKNTNLSKEEKLEISNFFSILPKF